MEPVKKLEQANTRIAVLHVWSSSERMAPPFFQYWAASAVANDAIADFFIFVPDEETALVLRDLLPPLSSNHNIKVKIVGDLLDLYNMRIGADLLQESGFVVSSSTLASLKPLLGHVFAEYTEGYSHWAWADMDMIYGNLLRFLSKPLTEGYYSISMSAVDYHSKDSRWESHLCSRYATAMAGQLTIFKNSKESQTFFLKHGGLSKAKASYHFDEREYPALLHKLGVPLAHVFGQVTDQFGFLNGKSFEWSPHGLLLVGESFGGEACYEYEAGIVHMM